MGRDIAVHVGPTSSEAERRGAAAAAASWLGAGQQVGLVVSTSHTSESDRALVRAVTERIPVRSAWAHSVRHGAATEGLDAIIVVAPDAELLEWVIDRFGARLGSSPDVVVLGASGPAVQALLARGSRPLPVAYESRIPATREVAASRAYLAPVSPDSVSPDSVLPDSVLPDSVLLDAVLLDAAPAPFARRWAAPFGLAARIGA
ncbi:hypothetical protein [Mycetocola sp. JXN-3]|uniref:hypothetical protein n=1 Tax=Mycetocola sp. JXN-3 TaxID=2116510 RepID=UPI00165D1D4C|nr:hypothetical protein [Mycetocola sp. JXN-3]